MVAHWREHPGVKRLLFEGIKRETKVLKIVGSFPLEYPDPPSPESHLDRSR